MSSAQQRSGRGPCPPGPRLVPQPQSAEACRAHQSHRCGCSGAEAAVLRWEGWQQQLGHAGRQACLAGSQLSLAGIQHLAGRVDAGLGAAGGVRRPCSWCGNKRRYQSRAAGRIDTPVSNTGARRQLRRHQPCSTGKRHSVPAHWHAGGADGALTSRPAIARANAAPHLPP